MYKKVSHIGVAVKDLEKAKEVFRTLGLDVEGEEVVEEQKVKVAFIPVGETRIELLEATAPDSPVAKFIEKKGEGVHHVALGVDNLEVVLEELKAKGVRLVDEKPRRGAHNTLIAFLHPKSTGGLLLELCQEE
ncbi:MAG TPA: methylmalonyl-CoA epimerase [Thermosulfidibacter takaii]|uniref:Methylmalonyl-CoA epimerase n=1 Tax=Thermosulfidibacter takaii TaxID=412593 RepID=A0A7C0YCN6_9BACT|nr:methylmalonyl-CoA epimerase [Thermosulfidibacter takaii]